jgi:Cdc6-like AAA superfamily ATPase
VFLIQLFSYSLAILLLNAGIANTMDLPEKLLPRISSRMGIQRLCFGPYNYRQLQEIISSRLKGINAFEEQAIEFASRKVCILFVLMSISLLLSIVLLRVCLV